MHPRGMERWLSGRKHRTRNAAYVEAYRGFESHPLRHWPDCPTHPRSSPLVQGAALLPERRDGEPGKGRVSEGTSHCVSFEVLEKREERPPLRKNAGETASRV